MGEVVVQAVRDLFEDSGPQWAAAIAYYSLLSTFPLLLAIVSIAAFFVEPQTAVDKATQLLGGFLPQGTDLIQQIVNDAIQARGSVSILSIGSLLWSGSRVFGVITKALNIAYDVDELYGFWKRTLIELIMLATIGLIFILALTLPIVVDLLRSLSNVLPGNEATVLIVAGFLGQTILLFSAFLLTYRFVPRRPQRWRSAIIGASVATVLVLAARPLFFSYVQHIGQYNITYGSIALVVILVLWVWVVALILLFGGELASHTQAMLFEQQSVEEVKERHQARSPSRTT